MPILGEHDVGEAPRQPVDRRHDLVAAGHRQGAAGAEIVLHVNHDQHVRRADY
jgi:hypothetical protein